MMRCRNCDLEILDTEQRFPFNGMTIDAGVIHESSTCISRLLTQLARERMPVELRMRVGQIQDAPPRSLIELAEDVQALLSGMQRWWSNQEVSK